MANSIKRTYKEQLKNIFYTIKVHPWYTNLMILPRCVRLLLGIILFLFGIIGLLTPIPAGWIMVLLAMTIIFGIHTVRRHSIRIFFLLRLHLLWEWIKKHMKR